jgi:hypothetical protein
MSAEDRETQEIEVKALVGKPRCLEDVVHGGRDQEQVEAVVDDSQ